MLSCSLEDADFDSLWISESFNVLVSENKALNSIDFMLCSYSDPQWPGGLNSYKSVVVEDPYIRATHQIQNFIRFCEAVLKQSTVKNIELIISYDDNTNVQEMAERLLDVKQSLLEFDVNLNVKVNEKLHDREIRIDNGWVVKIGLGLDFFQKPDSWFGVGVNDLTLRKCLETKVDIFMG